MNFISYSELVKDTLDFIHKLPKFDCVAGVPRSGMIPATIISQQLHIPIYIPENGWLTTKYGQRIRKEDFKETIKNILLIDDSVCFGTSINNAKKAIPNRYKIITAALYGSQNIKFPVNYIYKEIKTPRIFEWNIFQHSMWPNIMSDLDGIYCKDPPFDDDGPIYTKFIRNTRPIRHIPNVGGIVTCRLEKYRVDTEGWLQQNNMLFSQLYMMQYRTAVERRKEGKYAEWKAEIYGVSKKASLFIESNIKQGKNIYQLSDKPVLVIDNINNIKKLIQ